MQILNLKEKMVYSDKFLTKKIVYRDKDVLAFVLNFKPGQSLPSHNHPGMVTIIQILKGKGKFTADNVSIDAEVGQVMIYQENEMVSLVNDGGEELSLYVTLTPGPGDERFAEEI
ncbi:MAG: cupin domain-containing protein [Bacillota bacterium]